MDIRIRDPFPFALDVYEYPKPIYFIPKLIRKDVYRSSFRALFGSLGQEKTDIPSDESPTRFCLGRSSTVAVSIVFFLSPFLFIIIIRSEQFL